MSKLFIFAILAACAFALPQNLHPNRKVRDQPIVIRDDAKNYTIDFDECMYHVTLEEMNIYPDWSEFNSNTTVELYRYDKNFKFEITVEENDFYMFLLLREIDGELYQFYIDNAEDNCSSSNITEKDYEDYVNHYFGELSDTFPYTEKKEEEFEGQKCTVYIYTAGDMTRKYFIDDDGRLVYSEFTWEDDGSIEANKYTYNKDPAPKDFAVEAKVKGCLEAGYEEPEDDLCAASAVKASVFLMLALALYFLF